MNFLTIARRDISSIFKNRYIKISVIAITIVPLLYSLLYLYAFWDPYSKLMNMPVAIVNLDQGADSQGEQVNLGNEIVDMLKTNDQVGWQFVSFDEADQGVKGKKYYAMFLIPGDFSENLLSAQSGTPEQAQILYRSNDKRNFLAAQINHLVLQELKSEITKNITSEYTRVMFTKLYEVKDGLTQAADGSGALHDGILQVRDGSLQLRDGIGQMQAQLPAMADGVHQLYTGSEELRRGISDAKDGAHRLQDGLSELQSNVPSLSDGVAQLYRGSEDLQKGMEALQVQGLQPVAEGVNQLYDNFHDTFLPGMKQLDDGAAQLADGLAAARDASGQLAAGAAGLRSGAAELQEGAGGFSEGSDRLRAGFQPLQAGAEKLNKGAAQITAGSDPLASGADQIQNGLAGLRDGLGQLDTGAAVLKEGAAAVADGVDQVIAANREVQASLKTAVDKELAAYLKKHPGALLDPNMQKFLLSLMELDKKANSKDTAEKLAQLQKGAHDLADGAGTLSGGIHDAHSGAGELAQGSQALVGGVGQLVEGVKSFSAGAADFVTGAQSFAEGAENFSSGTQRFVDGAGRFVGGAGDFAAGAGQFSAGVGDALQGMEELHSGVNALYQGAVQFDDGLGSLHAGMPVLLTGWSQVSAGSRQLRDGLTELNGQLPNLTQGTKQLTDGSDQLYTGMGQLHDGSAALSGGLHTLDGNMPALADGVARLAAGSADLTDGMAQLTDGSGELAASLRTGADEIARNLVTGSDEMAAFVSEPVAVEENPINPVANYGTGFAPYFIPLSIWVGAIMMFFVITEKVDKDIKASSFSLVIGKYLSYCVIGIFQASLASVIVLLLGLSPNHLLHYFLFNIFMSFVFIAIIQSLVFLLGQAGRLLSIVLLILQLTACAGTFPLEVVPTFFKVLNPFMPFTYCVSGLREIISGTDLSILGHNIAVLGGVMIVFLFISVFMKGHADRLQQRFEEKRTAFSQD